MPDAKITRSTRRCIADAIQMSSLAYYGALEEQEFLDRVFDLGALPSTDGRFASARGDIWQHRVNNYDWPDNWVYSDSRLNLMLGSDESFLDLLCEMLHPLVRPDLAEVDRLLALINPLLASDGYALEPSTPIAGKPTYTARPLLTGTAGAGRLLEEAREKLSSQYVAQQVSRMQSSVETDPELAIGTAKEFVETVCKTILAERHVQLDGDVDFPALVRRTTKELSLAPEDVPERAKAVDSIRVLLHNLANISNQLSELRNPYGTGHGKEARMSGLRPRHARLAVGAATTLAVFLLDTHQENANR
jgi:hypothetical protein